MSAGGNCKSQEHAATPEIISEMRGGFLIDVRSSLNPISSQMPPRSRQRIDLPVPAPILQRVEVNRIHVAKRELRKANPHVLASVTPAHLIHKLLAG